MNLEEWNQLCRTAWENEYEYFYLRRLHLENKSLLVVRFYHPIKLFKKQCQL